MSWRHDNPVTGSRGSSEANAYYTPEVEFDSAGVNVGFREPPVLPSDFQITTIMGVPLLAFDIPGGYCLMDGMQIRCDLAEMALRNGSAVLCPSGDCGPRRVDVEITYVGGWRETFSGLTNPFAAFADGRSGFGLGGMLLPSGFNARFTGLAAQAAAGAFFSGMATGNFGAGVSQGLAAGQATQAAINAANKLARGELEEFLKKNPKCAEILSGSSTKSLNDFSFVDVRQQPGILYKTLSELGGVGDVTLGAVLQSGIAYTIAKTSTVYLNNSYFGQTDPQRGVTLTHEMLIHAALGLSHMETATRLGINYVRPPMPPADVPPFASRSMRAAAEVKARFYYERSGGPLDDAASGAIDRWIANGCQ